MSSTYTSELLNRPGATAFHYSDQASEDAKVLTPHVEGVAWHYGNPLAEQRHVDRGGAIIDRSHRRVLTVSGADAGEFLNNLLSQKLDDAADGWSAQGLDLDLHGHILHHATISVVGSGAERVFYLDTTDDEYESLKSFLEKMVFWSQVTIADTDLALLTVLGAKPQAPEHTVFIRRYQWNGPTRYDIAVPQSQLVSAVDELETAGLALVGLMAFTAERVKALDPELAVDLDSKSIPHEVPHWIGRGDNPGAVHLEKGCYRGQETVARVENLGRSPRLLVLLHLDGSAPTMPNPGADITANSRRVGRLGTVIDDCDFGPIALAVVKRSALDVGQLEIGDVAAKIDADSLALEEGEKAGRAAISRLKGH